MSYPAVKLVVLFVVLLLHRPTTTPPNPPPTKQDKVVTWQLFDYAVRWTGPFSQICLLAAVLCEITVIASTAYSAVPSSAKFNQFICPHPISSPGTIQNLPTVFVVGSILATLGAYIRIWSQKALGRLFTHEVTVRPSHELITSGPYSFVRHPGYTGLFAHLVGVALMEGSPSSWIQSCGIMHTAGSVGIVAWCVIITWAICSLSRRGKVEDALLEKQFGDTWRKYQSRVPCKYFPGVL